MIFDDYITANITVARTLLVLCALAIGAAVHDAPVAPQDSSKLDVKFKYAQLHNRKT